MMFGKKDGLKYIKVVGRLKSRGEYDTSQLDVRPYEAVTLIDAEGQDVHFKMLIIPKRLDEEVTDLVSSFYILRYRNTKGLIGALYAMESNGKKIFFQEDAVAAAKLLSRSVSRRWIFLSNPQSGAGYGIIAMLGGTGLWLVVSAGVGSVFGSFLGGVAGLTASASWMFLLYYPLFRPLQYAGLNEMSDLMAQGGFKPTPNLPERY